MGVHHVSESEVEASVVLGGVQTRRLRSRGEAGVFIQDAGLTAPLVVDGAIFLSWGQQLFTPTLHVADIVVMDNLSA